MENGIGSQSLPPVYDINSKVLLLGTLPSKSSIQKGFYYSNPNNRFWLVISRLYEEPLPQTVSEKHRFLINHNIALWDIIRNCNIRGSADKTIDNTSIMKNDLSEIFEKAKIIKVFALGRKAERIYNSSAFASLTGQALYLPSTSPANTRFSSEELIKCFHSICQYTDQ